MLSCDLNRELIFFKSEKTDVHREEENEGSSKEWVLSWEAEGEAGAARAKPSGLLCSPSWYSNTRRPSPASMKQSLI